MLYDIGSVSEDWKFELEGVTVDSVGEYTIDVYYSLDDIISDAYSV